jgi:predicted ribosomally synthesized peptide with nif11-like leader
MSEEQLTALLSKLKEDAGLQEKLKAAVDLDTAVAIAKEAGFDVSKADWLKYQESNKTIELELSDEELDGISGGVYEEFDISVGGGRTGMGRPSCGNKCV